MIGDNVPKALLEFARSVDATQIVLGASRKRPWLAGLAGAGTGQTVTRMSGAIDVHMVSHDYAGRGRTLPSLGYGLTPRRRIAGVVFAAVLLGFATRKAAVLGLLLALNLALVVAFESHDIGSRWLYYLALLVNAQLIFADEGWPALGAYRFVPSWLRS